MDNPYGDKAERNEAIVARLRTGETMTAVARDFGISLERVSQIRYRAVRAHRRQYCCWKCGGDIRICNECGDLE
jgi:rRNA maturation endonuclease Nob1